MHAGMRRNTNGRDSASLWAGMINAVRDFIPLFMRRSLQREGRTTLWLCATQITSTKIFRD